MPIRRPRRRPPGTGWFRVGDLALAVVAYVPLLLTHPGQLGVDTKTYLYVDPGRLLSRAPHLWDPAVGLGTVTHQNIGYLFPMGPYYALTSLLRIPDWIAQRFWMGSIIFLAGVGVRYLLRTLRWEGPGITVASFAYALSPYLLHYIYKHSVILLPFTALPWLLAFSARAIRQGGWRYPSLFALVTLAAGGINATSLLLVMIGPFLWVVHGLVVERDITVGKVWPPLARMGVLTLATSLWWIAGLTLQGSYGIDILRYTETYETVAAASTGPEVARGLGYWFFYGTDALGPWFRSAVTMTESLPAVALSFLVPGLALVAALLTRFRYRIFFVALGGAGLVISVGSHPIDSPTFYGRLFHAFTETSSGLALRSAPRAAPMWALAVAVFLGAGVAAASARRPANRLIYAVLAVLLVIANLSPLWMGRMLDPNFERDVDATDYWRAVGRYLDAGDAETRALEIPGTDFAVYRWGASIDTLLPGLTDRDTAGRELVPWGSIASADMTNAVDAGFQDASFDPSGYAALLGNLSVGDLVVRNDLEYERYRTPRPERMTAWIDQAAVASQDGPVVIGAPREFGPNTPNRASATSPMYDDTELARRGTRSPAAVEVRPVDGSRPVVAAVRADSPTVLAGSAAGVVALANAGLLDDGLLVYSGSVSDDEDLLQRLADSGARLVVTDTNRKAAHRWGALRDQQGYTEMADEPPAEDAGDARLDLFGRLDDTSTQTVTIQQGGLRVTASGYGNQLTSTPSDRAANAFDDDERTAWKVGAFSDVRGEWIQAASTDGPITTDRIQVVQAQRAVNRWITRVRLTFDGGDPVEMSLGPASRTQEGQELRFDERTFRTLRIEVLATDLGVRADYTNISGVGFTRIDLDGRVVHEVIRPPTDLLDALDAASSDHDLYFLFTRQRTDPTDENLQSAEMRILRMIEPPTARTATVAGKVRLDTTIPDEAVDAELGVTGSGGSVFASSGRLEGDVRSRASAAFDGDDDTWWQSGLRSTKGSWVGWRTPVPTTATVAGLDVVVDGLHSVPTAVRLEVDGVLGPSVPLEGLPERASDRGEVTTLTLVEPQTVTGSDVRLVVDEVWERTADNWYTRRPEALPVAVAELDVTDAAGQPVRSLAPPSELGGACRTDLVQVGDVAVPLRVVGTTEAAAAGELLDLEPCPDSPPIELPAAETVVQAAHSRETRWSVDQLGLSSPSPASDPEPGEIGDAGDDLPQVRATRTGRGSYSVRVRRATEPFWLVLGQSVNPGWRLTVNGTDLGPSQLVSGYANGWLIDPDVLGAGHSRLTATLDWTPQRTVWIALSLSSLGVLACLLCLLPRFAGRREDDLTGLEPSRPVGISPFDAFGRPPRVRVRVLATLGMLATTAFVAEWWWAPVVAALTWAALSWRWGWAVLRAAVLATFAATAAYVLARQARGGFGVDFDWPLHFTAVSSLPAASLAMLGAEAVVEALRAGWRRDTGLTGPGRRRASAT